MDTNFDKKIFIKNFRENCNKIQIKKISKVKLLLHILKNVIKYVYVLCGEVDFIRYDVNGKQNYNWPFYGK